MSFARCTVGDIAIFSPTASTRTATPTSAIARGIPFIIVSHGKNGYGAYQACQYSPPSPYTPCPQLPLPTGADELANVTGTPAQTPTGWFASYAYYAREKTPYASNCSDTANAVGAPFCEFDDIVSWVPPSVLVTRMVSAGRLP